MYDLHNHLLPGIDDGAPNLTTALELANMAVKDGITHMVCTPHIHLGRFDNNLQSIGDAFSALQAALQENNIPLKIAAAAEVRIGPEIMQMAQNKTLPFVGQWQNKEVLLLEFPANAIPLGSEKLSLWLINKNIIPMIAHPERNEVFQNHPERLHVFIKQGCLTQITASALLGNFGHRAKHTAEKLLLEDKITIIASDAHNLRYRPPLLSESFKRVTELTSTENAQALFIYRPKQMSHNKFTNTNKAASDK